MCLNLILGGTNERVEGAESFTNNSNLLFSGSDCLLRNNKVGIIIIIIIVVI